MISDSYAVLGGLSSTSRLLVLLVALAAAGFASYCFAHAPRMELRYRARNAWNALGCLMVLAAVTCAFAAATCRGTMIHSRSDEAVHHQDARWKPARTPDEMVAPMAQHAGLTILEQPSHSPEFQAKRDGRVQSCKVWADGPATWQGQAYVLACDGTIIDLPDVVDQRPLFPWPIV